MVWLRNSSLNCIKFYCKLWNFRYVWRSVNTNDNYGTIVWKRNLYHTDLIICMTHWKIGHMCRCVGISNKDRDTASWFVNTLCKKASITTNITSVGRKPSFWHHNNVSCTTQFRCKWMKFVKISSKRTYVFMQDKKKSTGILQHYWKLKWWSNLSYQHYYYRIPLLSLVSLSELNIWSNSAADKLATSIFFLRLLNCLMTSFILKGGLRMSLFSLMSFDRFSFVGSVVFFL